MTTARFSHAQCPHPSTKAARAKCRAALRAAAAPADTASKAKADKPRVAASPATETAPAAPVAVAREEVCGKCGEAYVTTAPESIDVDPLCDPCVSALSDAAVEVTPDTWRDHTNKPASIFVVGVEEPFAAQAITGYSIKFLQFVDAEGAKRRIPATTVERVTV